MPTAYVAAVALAAALGLAAGASPRVVLVAPITLALLGVLRTVVRWRAGFLRRVEADRWILEQRVPARFEWRVDELTSAHERTLLARSLRGIVDDLSPRRLPGASPLNRVALRPHADLIGGLAERLDETKRPVAPAGVVRVRRLLTGPESPLYLGSGADIEAQSHEAERELARALRSLEVR
ncbi:MAG TPA: hypothetical protein VH416_01270 [Gaiellaceae bacterium]